MSSRPGDAQGQQVFTILLPALGTAGLRWLLPLALRFARDRAGELVLLGVVEVQADRSLSEGALPARQLRSKLEALAQRQLGGRDVPWRVTVRVVRESREGILEEAERAQLLLLHLPSGETSLFGQPLQAALRLVPCDLVILRDRPPRHAERVLCVLGEDHHAGLCLRASLLLTEESQASLTIVQPLGAERGPQGEGEPGSARYLVGQLERVNRLVALASLGMADIRREARAHQLVVMPASRMGQEEQEPLWGQLAAEERLPFGLVLVRARRPEAVQVRRHEPPSRLTETPLSVMVEKWFAENTFHSHEFAQVESLVALKRQQGLSISLGLPTLNEEATVGRVIDTMLPLVEAGLLDEVVLIDSGSTDYTVEIARERGVPAYRHQDILPQHGSRVGKGEALWKSLQVLKGDLIAWMDTDIRNPHPRFLYGILGPLLRYPSVQYVKGFYRRPLMVRGKLQAGGGGRVTELTARPLLNLLFPELSGIIQPLAGEYAGRRRVLERVGFYSGYGVEVGLLIAILRRFGLSAIAQVDLEQRIHRNRKLHYLSKMAFSILQAVIQELGEAHDIRLMERMHRSMKLIRYEPGHFFLEVEEIEERRRPPILLLPEYRRARRLSGRGPHEALPAAG